MGSEMCIRDSALPDAKIEAYMGVRSARFVGWPASGGGAYIETGFNERPQLFQYDAPLAGRRQLTALSSNLEFVALSPTSRNFIAIIIDESGDENFSLKLWRTGVGELQQLSTPGTKTDRVIWAKDGTKLSWIEQSGRERALIVFELGSGRTERIATWERNYKICDWSYDGKTLLLKEIRSVGDSSLFTFDFSTRLFQPLFTKNSSSAFGDALFGTDEQSIFYTANSRNGFKALYRYNRKSRSVRRISDYVRWDVDQFAIAPETGHIAYTVNRNGGSTLVVISRRGRKLPTLKLPPGFISDLDFSNDGIELGFTFHASAAPSIVYSFSVGSKNKELKIWSGSEFGGLDPTTFVAPQSFSYRSFDGLKIRANKLAIDISEGRKHPVLIKIHGGPEAQARPSFNGLDQYLVKELGFVVIYPNIRGSTGYGDTFESLDDGLRRQDAVQDVISLYRWVKRQDDLDPSRVFVYGASYGGYVALMALISGQDTFRGGISVNGVTDIEALLLSLPPERRVLRRAEYGDERNEEMQSFFRKNSPLKRANEISVPVLVVQSQSDARVSASLADMFVEAMCRSGGTVVQRTVMNEGHSVRQYSSRLVVASEIVEYLRSHSRENSSMQPIACQ